MREEPILYGVYLITVLVLVGGAIAYIGDRIGRSVGRHKLTLLGLRPKHTSVIITVLTGLCIVAASIGTMAWLSHDVRTALFHMQEIQDAYRESRRQYTESQKHLDELRSQVALSEEYLAGIITARDAAAEETRALQLHNVDLQERLLTAKHDLDQWKSQVIGLQTLGEELQDNIRQLEVTKAQLEGRVSTLTDEMRALEAQLRQGSFVFLTEEIVHAEVFAGGRSAEHTQRDLLTFLEKAEAVALARGARISGKERAIEIAHEDYFFQTVELLSQSDTRWVVRAVALQNTVRGEPLLIFFHLFPEVEPIYRHGDVIAEQALDPAQPDLEGRLLGLLQRVNEDALKKGMITGESGNVGEVTSEAFIDALVRLRQLRRPANVQVLADAETWITQGPLRVSLVVEELK